MLFPKSNSDGCCPGQVCPPPSTTYNSISAPALLGYTSRRIVVPSSTLENWLREFQMFSPDLHVEPYYGKKTQREDQQYQIEAAGSSVKVIVTTYQIAANEKDNQWLRKLCRYSSVIFDEGHMLKNATSPWGILNRVVRMG